MDVAICLYPESLGFINSTKPKMRANGQYWSIIGKKTAQFNQTEHDHLLENAEDIIRSVSNSPIAEQNTIELVDSILQEHPMFLELLDYMKIVYQGIFTVLKRNALEALYAELPYLTYTEMFNLRTLIIRDLIEMNLN